MHRCVTTVATVSLVLGWTVPGSAQSDAERSWGQWRGPEATGVGRHADPPLTWSETEHIAWKVEVPGRGSASPIVWGDKVFLLTAVPIDGPATSAATGCTSPQPPPGRRAGRGGRRGRRGPQAIPMHRFMVMAFDRETGAVVWERVAREEVPHEGYQQPNGTYASGSAVTDGERLYAFFGSWGLYAYDMDGELQWEVDLGTRLMRNAFGEGSTPALHGDTLVVTWDHIGGQSFVAAIDTRTGDERWRSNRDEIDTWATPLIVEHEGRAQVITPAMDQVYSYDLETGETIWRSRGTTMNAIPSPVHAGGIVYVTSGYRGSNLQAIRLADARGDIADTGAIVWQLDRDTPYVPSPLLYDEALYHPQEQRRHPVGLRPGHRRPALRAPAVWRAFPMSSPPRSAPPDGSTSPAATARRWSSGTAGATRCSPRTRSTTGSTPHPHSSTTNSICAAAAISTRLRKSSGLMATPRGMRSCTASGPSRRRRRSCWPGSSAMLPASGRDCRVSTTWKWRRIAWVTVSTACRSTGPRSSRNPDTHSIRGSPPADIRICGGLPSIRGWQVSGRPTMTWPAGALPDTIRAVIRGHVASGLTKSAGNSLEGIRP